MTRLSIFLLLAVIASALALKVRLTKMARRKPVPLPRATVSTRNGISVCVRNRLRAERTLSASITPLQSRPWRLSAS